MFDMSKSLNFSHFNSDDSIPFGPWCFYQNQDLLAKNYHLVPKIVLSREQHYKNDQIITALFFKYLDHLTQYLNRKNNTQFSNKFWGVYAGDWLLGLFSSLVSKYSFLEKFFEENPNDKFSAKLIYFNANNIFNNELESNINFLTNVDFNHYLFSEVIRKCFSDKFSHIEEINFDFQPQRLPDKKSVKKGFFNRILIWLKNSTPLYSVPGMPPHYSFVLGFFLFFKKYISSGKSTNSKSNKNELSHPLLNTDWSDIIEKNIPFSFFKVNEIKSEKKFRVKYYLTPGVSFPITHRKRIAIMYEKGVQIYSLQHGSNYGDFLCSTRNKIMEMYLDGFVSWGTTSLTGENLNIKALPSPAISRYRKQYRKYINKETIILVSTVICPYDLYYCSGYSPYHIHEYLGEVQNFLGDLNEETLISFYYRPRLSQRTASFDMYDSIQKNFPNIPLLEGNLDQKMLLAKLIICDSPGATMLKSIGSNIPTVFFWDRKTWVMSEEFERFIDEFKTLNIFFDSATEAATFVNSIAQNPFKWWLSSDVQDCINRFSSVFAKNSDHYFKDWFYFLKNDLI